MEATIHTHLSCRYQKKKKKQKVPMVMPPATYSHTPTLTRPSSVYLWFLFKTKGFVKIRTSKKTRTSELKETYFFLMVTLNHLKHVSIVMSSFIIFSDPTPT